MKASFIEIITEEAAASKRHFFYILSAHIETSGTSVVLMRTRHDTVCPIFALKLNRLAPTTWMTTWNLYINLKLIS